MCVECGHSILYHLFAQIAGKCIHAGCKCPAYLSRAEAA